MLLCYESKEEQDFSIGITEMTSIKGLDYLGENIKPELQKIKGGKFDIKNSKITKDNEGNIELFFDGKLFDKNESKNKPPEIKGVLILNKDSKLLENNELGIKLSSFNFIDEFGVKHKFENGKIYTKRNIVKNSELFALGVAALLAYEQGPKVVKDLYEKPSSFPSSIGQYIKKVPNLVENIVDPEKRVVNKQTNSNKTKEVTNKTKKTIFLGKEYDNQKEYEEVEKGNTLYSIILGILKEKTQKNIIKIDLTGKIIETIPKKNERNVKLNSNIPYIYNEEKYILWINPNGKKNGEYYVFDFSKLKPGKQ